MKLSDILVLLFIALLGCSEPGDRGGTPNSARGVVAPPAGPPPGELITRSRERVQSGRGAIEAGDTIAFLTALREAESLRPGHQTLILQLAWAYALADSAERALDEMERYAAFGFVPTNSPDRIPGFEEVIASPRWPAIEERIETNRAEFGTAVEAFRLPTRNFVPEGIAYDAQTGDSFVGSVHLGEIVRVGPDGTVERFAGPEDGLWSSMGMRVDSERRHLWVATTAVNNFRGYSAEDEGRSAVLRFHLDEPNLAPERFEANQEDAHWFGDLVVAPDGTVYISDSLGSAVYVLLLGTSEIELLTKTTDFPSPQGIDLATDGTLYLADYAAGIYAIDVTSGAHQRLTAPNDVSLLGIDGLYWHDGSLIAIQNGINPHRVTQLHLDESGLHVTRAEILEVNRSWFAEPTLGAVVGDDLLFVANSQWFRFDQDGGLPAAEEMQEPLIVRRSLP